MTTEQFRNTMKAKPFRPFVLKTADGRDYPVHHPEFAWQSQGGRTVVVGTGDEDFVILDLLLVTAIEVTAPSQPSQTQRS